ncbi:helix-turn-helix domain-containing protein [Agrobacterium sp. rho-13.3]|uniref:helix-turn-helix domain-containing protein n=1 Tax=Agrobacterium sp. rho-13.3 TaxID=3072980 RepID=UPI002A168F0C|nr:helix-turn-helix transcriptional regulator [Agrobacterium sp. rho-13.3]MDX8307809.1 helix-turn-helix transcriptional regulator [Agrobacterium sp. rho-13.3]
MFDNKLDDVNIVRSSGDIFADLGVELDAKDRLKIDIARRISAAIEHRKLTQKQVAAILKTDQAKVSNITRGKLKDFTVDRLVNYLIELGIDIDVRLSETHERRGKLSVRTPVAACG